MINSVTPFIHKNEQYIIGLFKKRIYKHVANLKTPLHSPSIWTSSVYVPFFSVLEKISIMFEQNKALIKMLLKDTFKP